jgi:hypothetical protein
VLAITAVVAVHLLVQSKPSSVHFGLVFVANVQRAGVELGSESCDLGLDESDDLVGVGINHFAETVAFGGGGGFGVVVSESEIDFAVVTFGRRGQCAGSDVLHAMLVEIDGSCCVSRI